MYMYFDRYTLCIRVKTRYKLFRVILCLTIWGNDFITLYYVREGVTPALQRALMRWSFSSHAMHVLRGSSDLTHLSVFEGIMFIRNPDENYMKINIIIIVLSPVFSRWAWLEHLAKLFYPLLNREGDMITDTQS